MGLTISASLPPLLKRDLLDLNLEVIHPRYIYPVSGENVPVCASAHIGQWSQQLPLFLNMMDQTGI